MKKNESDSPAHRRRVSSLLLVVTALLSAALVALVGIAHHADHRSDGLDRLGLLILLNQED